MSSVMDAAVKPVLRAEMARLTRACWLAPSSLSIASCSARIQMLDEEDANIAFLEMDMDGDGTIDPMEFEAWFKRQVLEVRATTKEEEPQLAVRTTRSEDGLESMALVRHTHAVLGTA